MVEYYKTQKGYCYKKTQKGGASRISVGAYEKAILKQKGGKVKCNNIDKNIKQAYNTMWVDINVIKKKQPKEEEKKNVKI